MHKIVPIRCAVFAFSAAALIAGLFAQPGSPSEPVRLLSAGIDLQVHDGRLRPAIGGCETQSGIGDTTTPAAEPLPS